MILLIRLCRPMPRGPSWESTGSPSAIGPSPLHRGSKATRPGQRGAISFAPHSSLKYSMGWLGDRLCSVQTEASGHVSSVSPRFVPWTEEGRRAGKPFMAKREIHRSLGTTISALSASRTRRQSSRFSGRKRPKADWHNSPRATGAVSFLGVVVRKSRSRWK